MTRTFPALCLASTLALAGSLSAQQASPNQPARNDGVTTPADYEQTASKTGSTDSLMLTGCLDRAANGTYELRNARMSAPGAANTTASSAPGSASTTSARAGDTTAGAAAGTTTGSPTDHSSGTAGATGTSGTTASATGTTSATSASKAPMSDMAMTWTLKSSTDLAPHVGHQVQITGRPSAPAANSGSNTATTANPTTTATGARMESSAQNAHSVDVQAVRMISQSCS